MTTTPHAVSALIILLAHLLTRSSAYSQSSGSGGSDPSGAPSSAGSPMGGAAYSAKTDLITGRFSYSVPISIPPGRQGAAPVLGLAYNSAAGNSWCGVGWNLDIGFIQRDTRRGVPVKWGTTNALNQYDDAKGFVVNFGGVSSRLVLISAGSPTGTYEYRAEVDSTFLKYLYYTNDSSFGPAYGRAIFFL